MLKNLWIAAQFLLLEISLAAPLQAAILKAGVAKVDITPPAGQPMYGYGSRKSPSISTLDPLYARVLVLDVNGRRLTLVTLDLGQVFGPSSLERLKRVADDSISHLLVVASHTHSGPAIPFRCPSLGNCCHREDRRDRCPVRDAFFLGYANGDYGYFPTIRAASLGGYGAANSATYVEVGAGDRMLDRALVRLYEMLGRLVDLPEELIK